MSDHDWKAPKPPDPRSLAVKLEDADNERERLIALLTTVTMTNGGTLRIKLSDVETAYDTGQSIIIWAPDNSREREIIIKCNKISEKEMEKRRKTREELGSDQRILFDPADTSPDM